MRRNTREKEDGSTDPFEVSPFSGVDIAVHSAGGLLNFACLSPALVWLAAHASLMREGWPLTIAAVFIGTFVADFVSGLLHWSFDTWFGEDWPQIRRMVLLVREHHIYPQRIFQYHFWHDAGVLSWFALLVSAPVFAMVWTNHAAATRVDAAMVLGAAVASLEIVFMLEFHKWGHRLKRPPLVRALQWAQLLLSPSQHLRHHSGAHDRNYCLITGIFDRTAGRLGAWRGLERLVSYITAWVPRENDRVWLARYGRLPVGHKVYEQ